MPPPRFYGSTESRCHGMKCDRCIRAAAKNKAAGLPWFERDDYEAFQPILPDRNWHAIFDEWEVAANATLAPRETLAHLESTGVRAVKATIRSEAFLAWCGHANLELNTKVCLSCANLAAYRDIMGEH